MILEISTMFFQMSEKITASIKWIYKKYFIKSLKAICHWNNK